MRLRNRWRAIAIASSVLVAFATLPAVAQTVGLSNVAWADLLPSADVVYQPFTHGDGSVGVLYADPATHGMAVKTVGANREQFGTVMPTGQSFAAIGKNGDMYFTAASKITAQTSNGTTRWSTVVLDTCNSVTYLTHVTVGSDGSVYALAMPSAANQCAGSLQLVRYDALTGANGFVKSVGDAVPESVGLVAYKTGVALLTNQTVRYFDTLGAETSSFTGPSSDVQVNAEGTAVYALSHTANASDGCVAAASPVLDGILFRTIASIQMQATLHDCVQSFSVQSLSNGGVLINELAGGAATLVAVSANGVVAWRSTYPNMDDQKSRVGYLVAKADGNGNVVVVQQTASLDANTRYVVDVQVLNAGTGALQASFNTSSLDAAASFDWVSPNGYPDAIGLAPNRLYLALAKCTATTNRVASLYAVDLNGLTLDYPRAAVWGIGGQNPSPSPTPTQKPVRMVVMGDSYSSGEGVEPFDPATTVDHGKNANVCHRSELAYAHDVVRDRNNVQLAGFFACSGATTNEVARTAQYVTQPAQVKSLGKVKDVDVVVLSVGGNDIQFTEFATVCVMKRDVDCARQYKTSMKLVKNDLPAALKRTYAAIRGVVSARTQVLVLTYPTIVTYDPSSICTLPTNTALTAFKRTLAISLEDELNAVIKTAVKEAGSNFSFVDAASPSSPFWGHELCSSDPYFNGPTWPKKEYSFHPNAKGQKAYAQLVGAELQKKN